MLASVSERCEIENFVNASAGGGEGVARENKS